MGSACCAARKNENLSSRTTGELLHRNTIYSPSWSFRRDNRRRVTGEIENVSYGLSPGLSGDSSTEIKLELSLDRGSFASGRSPLRNLRITMSPKSPIREGLMEGHLDSSSDITNTHHGNLEDKSFRDIKESVGVNDSSEPKIPIHENPSSSSSLPPISDPTTSQNNSTHPRQISGSPVLIGSESHGGSSDGWSMRTFTELVASSRRERLSFESDSSHSPSTIDVRHCGICSKRLDWASNVAVLTCGHVYDCECLEKMTKEEERFDPSCPVCVFGSKQVIEMARKIRLAEEEERRRIMFSTCGIKTETSKPFLRRHFSLGSKWSRKRSLSENNKNNDRKGFWSRFH